MPSTIHTLSATFNLPLRHSDIDRFRSRIIRLAGAEQDIFHNHNSQTSGERYFRYPLVQYQIHDGNASLFGLDQGADAISKLLHELKNSKPGKRKLELKSVQETRGFKLALTAFKSSPSYRIYRYIALNPGNYKEYKSKSNFVEKVQLIEKLLANHIIGFCRQIDWKWPSGKRLEVVITDIDRISKVSYHNVDESGVKSDISLMAFDLVFKANIKLPDRMGLGNHPAMGYGWIYRL